MLDPLGLDQRVPGLEPHRREEGARHRAANQDVVHLGKQRLDQVDLAADLGPAEHRHERPLRLVERLAEILAAPAPSGSRDTAGLSTRATASVLACARCAEPKASFT